MEQTEVWKLVPYFLRNDDVTVSVLLVCFVVCSALLAENKTVFAQRFRLFFLAHTKRSTLSAHSRGELSPTANGDSDDEKDFYHLQLLHTRGGLWLKAMWGAMAGLLFLTYAAQQPESLVSPRQGYALWGAGTLACWVYLFASHALYAFVNNVFFDKSRVRVWHNARGLLIETEGLLLFVWATVMVFGNLTATELTWLLLPSIVTIRLLLFYQTKCIFFRSFHCVLHLFVYLCALEIVPLCGLWHVLTLLNEVVS